MINTNDKQHAKELATMMLKALASKAPSQPVKKAITVNLAKMLSTRANYQVRQLIHKKMLQDLAVSKTFQQRQAFLFFLEALIPQISIAHFNQVYMEKFFDYKDEVVPQILI